MASKGRRWLISGLIVAACLGGIAVLTIWRAARDGAAPTEGQPPVVKGKLYVSADGRSKVYYDRETGVIQVLDPNGRVAHTFRPGVAPFSVNVANNGNMLFLGNTLDDDGSTSWLYSPTGQRLATIDMFSSMVDTAFSRDGGMCALTGSIRRSDVTAVEGMRVYRARQLLFESMSPVGTSPSAVLFWGAPERLCLLRSNRIAPEGKTTFTSWLDVFDVETWKCLHSSEIRELGAVLTYETVAGGDGNLVVALGEGTLRVLDMSGTPAQVARVDFTPPDAKFCRFARPYKVIASKDMFFAVTIIETAEHPGGAPTRALVTTGTLQGKMLRNDVIPVDFTWGDPPEFTVSPDRSRVTVTFGGKSTVFSLGNDGG